MGFQSECTGDACSCSSLFSTGFMIDDGLVVIQKVLWDHTSGSYDNFGDFFRSFSHRDLSSVGMYHRIQVCSFKKASAMCTEKNKTEVIIDMTSIDDIKI